jgi:hypothetical protein
LEVYILLAYVVWLHYNAQCQKNIKFKSHQTDSYQMINNYKASHPMKLKP